MDEQTVVAARIKRPHQPTTGLDLKGHVMVSTELQSRHPDLRVREAAATIPVYGQMSFVPESGSGCDIITADGRRILDLYGGHAVAALGYVVSFLDEFKKLI